MSLKIVFHLSTTIKLVGGGKVAFLHLVEDGLRIDEPCRREIEVYFRTQKLLGKHGNVEMVGVKACEVAAFEHLVKARCKLFECGSIFHQVGCDAC